MSPTNNSEVDEWSFFSKVASNWKSTNLQNAKESDLQVALRYKDQLLEEFSFLKNVIGINDVTHALMNGVALSAAKTSLKQRFQFNGKIAKVVSGIDMMKNEVQAQVDSLVKNISKLTSQEQERSLKELNASLNDFRRKLVSLTSIAAIIKKRYFL